jgi:Immunity protein 22
MESPGVMSLWLGHFATKEKLEEYIEVEFNEEGDGIRSLFMRDFKMGFSDYDEDLLEKTFKEEATSSLERLLQNISYKEKVFSQFVSHYGIELGESFNTVIAIYDTQYDEEKDAVSLQDRRLVYMGSVVYEE